MLPHSRFVMVAKGIGATEQVRYISELIGMITDKNSLHDIDTFMFFKYVFKAWVAVYLVVRYISIILP